MIEIRFVCNLEKLTPVEKPVIASGDVNSVQIRVEFCQKWDKYAKSAVFFADKNPTPIERPMTANACIVPPEVLAERGTFYVGIRGVVANDVTAAVLTTDVVGYRVVNGAPSGVETGPTPDVYQQILTGYGNKQNKLAWATDADIEAMFEGTYEGEEDEDPEGNGYLPGKGPEGSSPDAVTYTPQDLTPEQQAQARANIGAITETETEEKVYLELEQGGISSSNGATATGATRLRSYYTPTADVIAVASNNSEYTLYGHFYGADMSYLGNAGGWMSSFAMTNIIVKIPNAHFFRIVVRKTGDQEITPSDAVGIFEMTRKKTVIGAESVLYTPQILTAEQQAQARENIGVYDGSNIHAAYFTITEDGVLSLKPEYRGNPTKNTYPDAISDNGEGVVGSRNAELPEHLVIPESVDLGGIVESVAVDRIADGAFYGNKVIKTITFPKTVKEIPASCFQDCLVENVYGVEQVTTIGTASFKYSNIKNVNLPNLATMGEGAFMNCSYITHANIGNVTEIPADGFMKCYALSRVESNNQVVSVGHTAFHNTVRLANADFVQNLTSIGAGAFIKSSLEYDWSQLENCTFGNNATSLQINPTDFWSACSVTPCENPMPTVLSQKDPRWKDRGIGNSGKTYSQGCMLFSIMSIYCGIHNLHLSTVEEFEEIIEGIKPGHLDTYTIDILNVPAFVEPLGLTGTLVDNYNQDNLQILYDALADGKYAVINTSSGAINGSMTGHAIVAYGLTPSGKIMFADSSSRYYNNPELGGGKYATFIKSTTANVSGNLPEFCIVEKTV